MKSIYENNARYILEQFELIFSLISKYLKCKEENSFNKCKDKVLEEFQNSQIISDIWLEKSLSNGFFAS